MIFSPLLCVFCLWFIQLYHKSGEKSVVLSKIFADETSFI